MFDNNFVDKLMLLPDDIEIDVDKICVKKYLI